MPLLFVAKVFLFLQMNRVYKGYIDGIAERCHSTIKRIAAWIWCSIQEAVYNVTPKDYVTLSRVLANGIYQYE